MAKILTFQAAEMRRDESDAQARRVSAEVIVFPGVRYEHWDEAGATEASAKRQSGPRRDVLELAD
jgi:hypothetical protein